MLLVPSPTDTLMIETPILASLVSGKQKLTVQIFLSGITKSLSVSFAKMTLKLQSLILSLKFLCLCLCQEF